MAISQLLHIKSHTQRKITNKRIFTWLQFIKKRKKNEKNRQKFVTKQHK